MEKGQFNHSVKVPKLYKCAAKIFEKVTEGAGSIKQLVYEKTHFNTKALFALVITAFQKTDEINLLLKRTKLLEKEARLDPWLARILISELLWGKKQLPKSESKPILTILAYEQAFHAHLSDSSWDIPSGPSKLIRKPRYVRINTLLTSVNEAVELFEQEGWILRPKADNYLGFLEQVSGLEDGFFLKDFHVSELLVFPSGTEFYSHPGYKNGSILLQDKASCLPVLILSPTPGSVVLDMCAAPGMKTSQMAAAMENSGTIYAVERSTKRFEVLQKMLNTAGATCVTIVNKDVLQCNQSDFPNVDYILVDPSCSGSGMVNRLEVCTEPMNPARLHQLAGFQIMILRSALTRYPNAKRVVYSTCSLHPEENEDVVRQVLETNSQYKLLPAGDFLQKNWINFGSKSFDKIGEYCLYARPEDDLTNGFFMAVFEQLGEGEVNEFYNNKVSRYIRTMQKNKSRKERKSTSADAFVVAKEEPYENDFLPENSAEAADIRPKKEKIKKRDNQEALDGSLTKKPKGRRSEDSCQSEEANKPLKSVFLPESFAEAADIKPKKEKVTKRDKQEGAGDSLTKNAKRKRSEESCQIEEAKPLERDCLSEHSGEAPHIKPKKEKMKKRDNQDTPEESVTKQSKQRRSQELCQTEGAKSLESEFLPEHSSEASDSYPKKEKMKKRDKQETSDDCLMKKTKRKKGEELCQIEEVSENVQSKKSKRANVEMEAPEGSFVSTKKKLKKEK